MRFEEAIQRLMAGEYIARACWGKGVYLFADKMFYNSTQVAVRVRPDLFSEVYALPLTDVLAQDWVIVT